MKSQIWPCQEVTVKGVKHFKLPFPTGETVTIPAADSDDPYFPAKLAQICVKQKAKTWARKEFPAAFLGLPN